MQCTRELESDQVIRRTLEIRFNGGKRIIIERVEGFTCLMPLLIENDSGTDKIVTKILKNENYAGLLNYDQLLYTRTKRENRVESQKLETQERYRRGFSVKKN